MSTCVRAALKERIKVWLGFAYVLGLCALGVCSVLVGWRALDDWCASKLEDE